MRIAFCKALLSNAKKNNNLVLLTGDVGYSVFEEFVSALPTQFLNMGVSEQNMTSVAAGLAMEGKIPFIYSIIPFVSMRNFEQIRNDICYQNLPVKIIGVGSGFSYGPYGHTHHALEDIGILRTLPNLTIFSPADPQEVTFAIESSLSLKGPVYIRLAKAGEPLLANDKGLRIGKGHVLKDGKDITMFSTGSITVNTLHAASLLKTKGFHTKVISMHTLKPLDEKTVLSCARTSKAIFTVEEHSIIGGLGSAVAEILAEHMTSVPFKRIAVPDRFTHAVGNQEYMRKRNDLSGNQIARTITRFMKSYGK